MINDKDEVRCDICAEELTEGKMSLFLEHFNEAEYDFCSWVCLAEFVEGKLG